MVDSFIHDDPGWLLFTTDINFDNLVVTQNENQVSTAAFLFLILWKDVASVFNHRLIPFLGLCNQLDTFIKLLFTYRVHLPMRQEPLNVDFMRKKSFATPGI